jgi:hypothetical protein
VPSSPEDSRSSRRHRSRSEHRQTSGEPGAHASNTTASSSGGDGASARKSRIKYKHRSKRRGSSGSNRVGDTPTHSSHVSWGNAEPESSKASKGDSTVGGAAAGECMSPGRTSSKESSSSKVSVAKSPRARKGSKLNSSAKQSKTKKSRGKSRSDHHHHHRSRNSSSSASSRRTHKRTAEQKRDQRKSALRRAAADHSSKAVASPEDVDARLRRKVGSWIAGDRSSADSTASNNSLLSSSVSCPLLRSSPMDALLMKFR